MFPQISGVYLFGKGWRSHYSHPYIYGPFPDTESLLEDLLSKFTTTDLLTYRSLSNEQSVNHFKAHQYKYIWFRLFFQVLSCLKQTEAAREEMLDAIKSFHSTAVAQNVMRTCEEFRRHYKREEVIQWYTRTAFFYISLNRSLRSEQINQIFRYRYVVSDLDDALRVLRNNQTTDIPSIVYRGQQMYRQELNSIF